MKRILGLCALCFFLLCGQLYADFESEVIDLVNSERAAQGLHPLTHNSQLAAAAEDHSEDMGMLGYFSHTSDDGRTVGDRITDAGYAYNTYGENIAAGYQTPEAVMAGWMSSSGHRANILNSNFCDIGVGYVYLPNSPYGHYWTQDFGRRQGTGTCPEAAAYVISASAGPGGDISPQGDISVYEGGDQTFSFTPEAGYSVAEILVDGEVQDIATSYVFADVAGNHTIAVSFAANQYPPSASAGLAQTVEEGETVTLDASESSDPDGAVVRYEWIQVSGAAVRLSDDNAVKPTFVAPPITEDSTVVLRLTVYDAGGLSDTATVEITIKENGIHDFPDDTVTLHTTDVKVLGLKTGSGCRLVSLYALDPAGGTITDRNGMPQDLIYGLLDFKIRVDTPGSSATVVIYLPEPAPVDYRWYKYSPDLGWSDYSDRVSFNGDRTRLTVTLVDGGPGDDDGEANGMIVDPSGLGLVPADTVSVDTGGDTSGSSSGGSGGGCFINSLF